MNRNVIDRCVVFEVREGSGGTDELGTIHRKAYKVALLERPSDLVSLASGEVCNLEEIDQSRSGDSLAVTLQRYCPSVMHTIGSAIQQFSRLLLLHIVSQRPGVRRMRVNVMPTGQFGQLQSLAIPASISA